MEGSKRFALVTLSALVAFGFVSLSPVSSVPEVSTSSGPSFADDFSTDTGLWVYAPTFVNITTGEYYPGRAYRDAVRQALVLTQNVNHQGGGIRLNQDIFSPFTAKFRYWS